MEIKEKQGLIQAQTNYKFMINLQRGGQDWYDCSFIIFEKGIKTMFVNIMQVNISVRSIKHCYFWVKLEYKLVWVGKLYFTVNFSDFIYAMSFFKNVLILVLIRWNYRVDWQTLVTLVTWMLRFSVFVLCLNSKMPLKGKTEEKCESFWWVREVHIGGE